MINYIHRGDVMTCVAPAGGVASSQALLVGALFGVAAYSAAAGEQFELKVTGVFDLPKADAQAWTQHQKIYWDNTAMVCTTVSTGGNTLIGSAAYAIANTAGLTTGRVRLSGNVY